MPKHDYKSLRAAVEHTLEQEFPDVKIEQQSLDSYISKIRRDYESLVGLRPEAIELYREFLEERRKKELEETATRGEATREASPP